MNALVDKIYKLLNKGASLSLIYLPSSGRRNIIKTLDEKLNSDEKFLSIDLDSKGVIQISALDFYKSLLFKLKSLIKSLDLEESVKNELLELVKESISSTDSFSAFVACKEIIARLLNEEFLDKVLVVKITGLSKFEDMDERFFDSIKSLRDLTSGRIAFVFVDTPQIMKKLMNEGAGELSHVLTNYVYVVPLPGGKLAKEVVDYNSDLYEFKVTDELEAEIIKLTSGYAGFIKYTLSFLKENDLDTLDISALIAYKPLASRIERLLGSLEAEDVDALKDLAHGVSGKLINTQVYKKLFKLGLISDDPKKAKILIPIVEKYIEEKFSKSKDRTTTRGNENDKDADIYIDKGSVYVDGELISESLSQREFQVLKYFLQNTNVVISREEISKIIWGSEAIEKYSDWAIDQVISRLRNKIGDSGYAPKHIKTLKGRGFRFEISK
jgi:hypothetical protein